MTLTTCKMTLTWCVVTLTLVCCDSSSLDAGDQTYEREHAWQQSDVAKTLDKSGILGDLEGAADKAHKANEPDLLSNVLHGVLEIGAGHTAVHPQYVGDEEDEEDGDDSPMPVQPGTPDGGNTAVSPPRSPSRTVDGPPPPQHSPRQSIAAVSRSAHNTHEYHICPCAWVTVKT